MLAGNYRIIYRADRSRLIVYMIAIDDRRDFTGELKGLDQTTHSHQPSLRSTF